MIDPKLLKLTKQDKLHYRNLIKNIDPNQKKLIVKFLRKKIQSILDSGNMTTIEVQLIQDIAKLNKILETNHNLEDRVVKKILFAMSYVINEDDEIPDIIPNIGYLDDISVVAWILEDIEKDL